MAPTRWDTQHPDLLSDWVKQDEADLQARNGKQRSVDARRDHELEAARDKHEAKLREFSPESTLYPGQKELADKEFEESRKGINEAHAKETSKIDQEYEQNRDANSRMRESLQTRMERELDDGRDDNPKPDDKKSALDGKVDADFNAPAVPAAPERKDDKAKAQSQATGKAEDEPLTR